MSDTNRRTFLKAGGTAVVATTIAGCTEDEGAGDEDPEDYPSQPIELIVPFAEGGTTDVIARQFTPYMSEYLDVDFEINNVEGAGSLRGIAEAYQADPDGYTLVMFNPPSTPVAYLLTPQDYELSELTPIATYATGGTNLAAHPDYGLETMDDVVDAYANGELEQWAGQEVGSYYHVISLVLRDRIGVEWDNYVGYGGNGPATESIVGGENPAGVSSPTVTQAFTEDDRLDVPVVLSSEGDPAYPDTPTITDEGYDNIDFISTLTRQFWAPPDTPDYVAEAVGEAVQYALEQEAIEEWADDSGNVLDFRGPDETLQTLEDTLETVPEEVDIDSLQEEVD